MTSDWPLPLIVFIVVIPLAIWRGWVVRRRRLENMRQLGVRLGLEFQLADGWNALPRLSGNLCGKLADVFTYTTGSGKHRKTWGVISVRPAVDGSALTFTLQRQGFGTKISELFGSRDIAVGDPAFDARVVHPDQSAGVFPRRRSCRKCARNYALVAAGGREAEFESRAGRCNTPRSGPSVAMTDANFSCVLADVVADLAELRVPPHPRGA